MDIDTAVIEAVDRYLHLGAVWSSGSGEFDQGVYGKIFPPVAIRYLIGFIIYTW